VFGHGTGSIHSLFEKPAVGQTGAARVASTNPHNQTLAVAIRLGLVGVAVLWAMWIAHLLLFRGDSFAEWIGLVIVVQNIVGSLFNSHPFDRGNSAEEAGRAVAEKAIFAAGILPGRRRRRSLPACQFRFAEIQLEVAICVKCNCLCSSSRWREF
jgi:hypothetical protein